MSRNWERLMKVVLDREEQRQLAFESSREPSFSTTASSFLSSPATPIPDGDDYQLGSSSDSSTVGDTDWESLLPSDYKEIISRSVNSVAYASKRALYLSLCNSPILLDGGKMSFQIDKMTGKKCYMIGAMDMRILRANQSVNSRFDLGNFTPHTDSRFSRVAKLKFRSNIIDIRGQIETQMLSPKTHYAAYLVCRIANFDIGNAKGIIKFVNVDADDEAFRRANILENRHTVESRLDGWMEVQLGMFYNDLGDIGPVEARLYLDLSTWNVLLFYCFVEGIEFRPTTVVADTKKNVRNGR